jgi:hypothetical protein
MGIEYSSASVYIEQAQDLKDRIAKIEKVIDALYTAAESAAENQDITSYSLDDGQTSISAQYRNPDQAFKAIEHFERLKQMYINKLNGRRTRLIPGDNFKGRYR